MKKYITTAIFAAAMTFTMPVTSFAGQWQAGASGWQWQNDDGSYPANTWQWIDGDGDGLAESYYFGADGCCQTNTITPDGCTVNENGAWTVDGAVQTQPAGGSFERDDLWALQPVKSNCGRQNQVKSCGETYVYDTAWNFVSNWFSDQYIVYANEHRAYDYLTVTFVPGYRMPRSSVGTFLVKGGYDDSGDDIRTEGDILEEIEFDHNDGPRTVTVDIGGYDQILVGLRHNEGDSVMVVPQMYFHN